MEIVEMDSYNKNMSKLGKWFKTIFNLFNFLKLFFLLMI